MYRAQSLEFLKEKMSFDIVKEAFTRLITNPATTRKVYFRTFPEKDHNLATDLKLEKLFVENEDYHFSKDKDIPSFTMGMPTIC